MKPSLPALILALGISLLGGQPSAIHAQSPSAVPSASCAGALRTVLGPAEAAKARFEALAFDPAHRGHHHRKQR